MTVKADLLDMIEAERNLGFYNEPTLTSARQTLPDSHQFTIHTALDDELIEFGQDMLKKGILRMPFVNTLVYVVQDDGHRGACLFHQDPNDLGDIGGLAFSPGRNRTGWQIMAWSWRVQKSCSEPAMWKAAFQSKNKFVSFSPLARTALSEQEKIMVSEWGGWWSTVLLATSALLISKSSSVEHVIPDQAINEARKKRGKRPLEEYHIVRLPGKSGGGSSKAGSTRKPVRMHWRRGHIRTLQSGKLIPVSPTIVGVGDKIIGKEYIFKQ